MPQRVTLGVDNYNHLFQCLAILKDFCTDIDLKDGWIRQRSNDNTAIFELDLTSLVGNISLPIVMIKQFLELAKMFLENGVEIETIERTDGANGRFILKDDYTKLEFDNPHPQMIDNKYIQKDDLDAIYAVSDENLVIDHNLNDDITSRIQVATKVYQLTNIQMKFEGETASLCTRNKSKDQKIKFIGGITSNIEIEDKVSVLSAVSFIVAHDTDINLKMYLSAGRQGTVINIVSTQLCDIPIKIYSRSNLLEESQLSND